MNLHSRYVGTSCDGKHAAESSHDDAVSGTENKLKQILVQVKYYQSIGKNMEGHDRAVKWIYIYVVYICFSTSEKRMDTCTNHFAGSCAKFA